MEISYSIADQQKGVALGEEDWFLVVDRQRDKWGIKLLSLQPFEYLTSWLILDGLEDLRRPQKAKILRKHLADRWGAKSVDFIIEKIILEIDQHLSEWQPPEEKIEEKILRVAPKVEAEVSRILRCEDPLAAIKEHLDNLIAGEDANKLTIFLLLLSGKCQDPKLKQMILIKGSAGAGKTTLMMIADLFKTKNVGRFTEHALDYADLEGFEVLKLKEIGHMDEEKQGTSTVKFLSSEDEGYIIDYTIRDSETNEFTTKRHTIPPITVISSTTRVSLENQYERRNWIISPDESEEQTQKIAEWIVRYENEKDEVTLGLRNETSYSFSKKVLKELVRRIRPVNIIIPFKKTLLNILASSTLRVRGDYKKLLALVKFYNILLQNQLPKITAAASHAILTTPSSALRAVNVALQPLVFMTSELDARTKDTLGVLEDLKVTFKGAVITMDTRREIATRKGWNTDTVRKYLNEIENSGYLIGEGAGTKKDPKTWRLLYSMDTIKRKMSAITEKIDNSTILLGEMTKEARNWLNSIPGFKKAEVESIYSSYLPSGIPGTDLLAEQPPSEETEEEYRQSTGVTEYQASLGPTPLSEEGRKALEKLKKQKQPVIPHWEGFKPGEAEITIEPFSVSEIASGPVRIKNPYKARRCDGQCQREGVIVHWKLSTYDGRTFALCNDCGTLILEQKRKEAQE